MNCAVCRRHYPQAIGGLDFPDTTDAGRSYALAERGRAGANLVGASVPDEPEIDPQPRSISALGPKKPARPPRAPCGREPLRRT
jgi:hypothetical protein